MAVSFCTLAEVRQLLQKKSTDKTQDPMIESLISRASAKIQNECERQFAPEETNVAKTFEWERQAELLSFAPWELQSLTNPATSVVVDADLAEPYVCTAEEYRLWPYSKRDGTYLGVRLRPFGASFGSIVWKSRQAKITGTWGMPSVPEDVIQATCVTVVHWVVSNTAVFRAPDANPNPAQALRWAIPPEALEMIERFKRLLP